MKKSILLAAAAALMLGAGPALAKKQLVIVVKGLDNPFFEAMHQGCEKWNSENKDSEYECFYTGPASTSDEAGEAQDFIAAHFLFTAERDRCDPETGGVGRRIARIVELRDHVLPMPATHHAIADAAQHDENDRRAAEAARNIPVEHGTEMPQRAVERSEYPVG